ncbi:MAG: hypothetical protein OEM90_20305, partial [Desulfobacteraceae bacterium]|nr:hypothetical protein [Desulfobacteraceae bacterium]
FQGLTKKLCSDGRRCENVQTITVSKSTLKKPIFCLDNPDHLKHSTTLVSTVINNYIIISSVPTFF